MHSSRELVGEIVNCIWEERLSENWTQSPFQVTKIFRQWQQSFFSLAISPQRPGFEPADRLNMVPRCSKSKFFEKSTHAPWFSHSDPHPLSLQLPVGIKGSYQSTSGHIDITFIQSPFVDIFVNHVLNDEVPDRPAHW